MPPAVDSITPATVSFDPGPVVPMPTLPDGAIINIVTSLKALGAERITPAWSKPLPEPR